MARRYAFAAAFLRFHALRQLRRYARHVAGGERAKMLPAPITNRITVTHYYFSLRMLLRAAPERRQGCHYDY